jgi:hypothetical protein
MAKAVDLQAVSDALATIRRTLREHPEVRERTAALFAGDPTTGDLDALQPQEESMASYAPLTVRVPQALVDRIDALVPLLGDEPELATAANVTRSDALRLCVLRGLEALEAKHETPEGKRA